MILEAFAQYLKSADQTTPAVKILARWLWEHLSQNGQTTIDQIVRKEIAMKHPTESALSGLSYSPENGQASGTTFVFAALSPSGQKLLNSLYHYALSWDQQKWARFVHTLKASDFKRSDRL